MSLSSYRSNLLRLQKDISDLRNKEAAEVKKAAEAQKKINSALDSARRAGSTSSANSYRSSADREMKNLQTAQENQSRYSSQAASKLQDATRLQEQIAKEEENERRKAVAADDKRRREEELRKKSDDQRRQRIEAASIATSRAMQQRIDELEAQVSQQLNAQAVSTPVFKPIIPAGEAEAYDVFISHAWEDKEDFVQSLADKARDAGIKVWYDKFSLQWGDSLRQKVDAGLAGSYFGIAVLSPAFFAKQWTQYELDGLLEKALSGTGRLLPIWHKLSKDEVAKHAPSLVGRLALNTSFMSTDEIVAELRKLRDSYQNVSLADSENIP